jgi:hypothetical protein
MGKQVAERTPEGNQDYGKNLWAALWNVNSGVAALAGKDQTPGREEQPPAFERLLGPFGFKHGTDPSYHDYEARLKSLEKERADWKSKGNHPADFPQDAEYQRMRGAWARDFPTRRSTQKWEKADQKLQKLTEELNGLKKNYLLNRLVAGEKPSPERVDAIKKEQLEIIKGVLRHR